MGHTPGALHQVHSPPRKPFRRRKRPSQWQFHYQIRSAAQRSFRPHVFAQHGRLAPLYKLTAHQAQDTSVISQSVPQLREQPCMSVVKRIELC